MTDKEKKEIKEGLISIRDSLVKIVDDLEEASD